MARKSGNQLPAEVELGRECLPGRWCQGFGRFDGLDRLAADFDKRRAVQSQRLTLLLEAQGAGDRVLRVPGRVMKFDSAVDVTAELGGIVQPQEDRSDLGVGVRE